LAFARQHLEGLSEQSRLHRVVDQWQMQWNISYEEQHPFHRFEEDLQCRFTWRSGEWRNDLLFFAMVANLNLDYSELWRRGADVQLPYYLQLHVRTAVATLATT
jgi:hypothetical protein